MHFLYHLYVNIVPPPSTKTFPEPSTFGFQKSSAVAALLSIMASLNPITPRTIARSNMFVLLFSFNYVHCTLNLLRNAISNRGGSSTLPQHSQAIPASHPSSALQGIIADGGMLEHRSSSPDIELNIHSSTQYPSKHSCLPVSFSNPRTSTCTSFDRWNECPRKIH